MYLDQETHTKATNSKFCITTQSHRGPTTLNLSFISKVYLNSFILHFEGLEFDLKDMLRIGSQMKGFSSSILFVNSKYSCKQWLLVEKKSMSLQSPINYK